MWPFKRPSSEVSQDWSDGPLSVKIIKLDAAMSSRITELIAEFLAEGDADLKMVELARARKVLPLAKEWTGYHFLTPGGDLLWYDDETGAWAPEKSPRARLGALVSGARLYVDLGDLLPRRPPSAVDCPQCNGVGEIKAGDVVVSCAPCMSLGWVHEDGNGPWVA